MQSRVEKMGRSGGTWAAVRAGGAVRMDGPGRKVVGVAERGQNEVELLGGEQMWWGRLDAEKV